MTPFTRSPSPTRWRRGLATWPRSSGSPGPWPTPSPGALADGALLVVLGGDCTITLASSPARNATIRHRLLYLDGDADLATPATTSSGVLNAMGIAHVLGLADTELARLGVDVPMLTDERPAPDPDGRQLARYVDAVTRRDR